MVKIKSPLWSINYRLLIYPLYPLLTIITIRVIIIINSNSNIRLYRIRNLFILNSIIIIMWILCINPIWNKILSIYLNQLSFLIILLSPCLPIISHNLLVTKITNIICKMFHLNKFTIPMCLKHQIFKLTNIIDFFIFKIYFFLFYFSLIF